MWARCMEWLHRPFGEGGYWVFVLEKRRSWLETMER
jgi:hypothetical protein